MGLFCPIPDTCPDSKWLTGANGFVFCIVAPWLGLEDSQSSRSAQPLGTQLPSFDCHLFASDRGQQGRIVIVDDSNQHISIFQRYQLLMTRVGGPTT